MLFLPLLGYSQIANYVSNGSFEDRYNCNTQAYDLSNAKGWRAIDSISNSAGLFSAICYSNSPNNGFTFQYPRTGGTYAINNFLCQQPECGNSGFNRFYLRNRLKARLEAGKTYCVKYYVNNTNNSTYGIDAYGFYFGDDNLDTITKCTIPLTYLTPQVQNPTNNIIIDTLNWVQVTGIFVAVGNEKHLIIGNFKSNANTNKLLINPTNLPQVFTDVCLDDVSCIDIDLPAFASSNQYCIPGNSVYIGRPRDVGIDEACMWYKIPNMTTAIDTAAGLVVYPTATSTYVVRQEICGNVKWDTVVVFASGVGLNELGWMSNDLKIFPVPAQDELHLQFSMDGPDKEFTKAEILNSLGEVVKKADLNYINKKTYINIKDLLNGMYTLTLKSNSHGTISKRFVVD